MPPSAVIGTEAYVLCSDISQLPLSGNIIVPCSEFVRIDLFPSIGRHPKRKHAHRFCRRTKRKKASGRSPTGHDYGQPKVEEGTDAFWQVRTRIEMSANGRRLLGEALVGSSGVGKGRAKVGAPRYDSIDARTPRVDYLGNSGFWAEGVGAGVGAGSWLKPKLAADCRKALSQYGKP
jgi:hypothetical protein